MIEAIGWLAIAWNIIGGVAVATGIAGMDTHPSASKVERALATYGGIILAPVMLLAMLLRGKNLGQ